MNQKTFSSFLISTIKFFTYLILFTPLIVSRYFFFPFVGPKSLYLFALSEIIFFAWILLIFFFPQWRPRLNPVLISVLIFLLSLFLSSLFGVSFSYSFWSKFERMTGLLAMLHLFAFFVVISSIFEKEDFKKFFAVSVGVALIVGIFAFLMRDPFTRGGGTLGNDSFLGTYLLFNLFFCIYLIFSSQRELKTFSQISFFILAFILILSGARAAKFSFLGGLVLFFLLDVAFFENKRFNKLLRVILILAFFLLILTVIWSFLPNSFVRKNFLEKIVGPTFGGRFVIWQGAWQGFLKRPIFGWGPENFEFSFTQHFDPCFFTTCGGEIWFDRAHNFVFDNLISGGILGLISYLLLFCLPIFFLWKFYFAKKLDLKIPCLFTSLFVSYLVQNLTVFDMPTSWLLIFLTLAFLANLESKKAEKKLPAKIDYFYILLFFPLFIFVFFKFVVLPSQTGMATVSAIKFPVGFPQRINFEKKALSASPLGKFQIREFLAENALTYINQGKIFPKGVTTEMEFLAQELEKSIQEIPLNFRSHLRLAQVYNFLSSQDFEKLNKAEEIAQKAIQLSPQNQQGYWVLAEIEIKKGDLKSALKLAQKALELEPNLKTSQQLVEQLKRALEK